MVEGVVRWFDPEEGWGVIDASEVPGGCFASCFDVAGGGGDLYAGQRVRFTFETPGFLQDGLPHRALTIEPS